MKFIILFLALSSSLFATNWNLVWSDEFDSDGTPDNTKWNFVTSGNADDWWNNEDENYTKEDAHNAWVENGNLIIEARYEKNTWPGDDREKDYTSARLTTKGKGDWTYGKMEIRAKLPTGNGTWPAIWLLASDNFYGGWPKSGEVDIMENLGKDPDIIHGTIHTEAYNHTKGTQKEAEKTVAEPYSDFHTYSVIWTPDTIKIAVDNDYYFSFGNEHNTWEEWPFDKDFHLILNVALGGWGGTVDSSILPQKMYVDYVRVYKDKDLVINDSTKTSNDSTQTSTNLIINGDFDNNLSPWIFEVNNGGAGSATVVNGEANIDITALGSNNWDVHLIQNGLSINANDSYTLKLKIKANATRAATFGISKNHGDYSSYTTKNINLTTSFQEFTINYTPTVNDDSVRFFIDLGQSDVNVIVDEVSIINGSTTGNVEKQIVQDISLSIYPNPFNPSTTIIFNSLTNGGKAVIYNILGQKIENFGNIKKGINSFIFNGNSRTSGIYFVKVYQGKFVYTKKMILIK